ncbi:MAG TPA: DUF1192 domain-containing protein [Sphingomicrobium sp.]|nr:DUF1192 domain-containing protein [Sphingomicrobium sp.]
MRPASVNVPAAMDEDDFFSSRPQDPLTQVTRQDLGPMSQDELQERIAILKAEIERVEQHMITVARHRSAADELFKRS